MITLNSLFQDGAVVQRGSDIPVWGTATPGCLLKATLAGRTAYGKVSSVGKFQLHLPPISAGGPYELTVSDQEHGESVTVRDVLVGEVWLASGQSNMAYYLGADKRPGQPIDEVLPPCRQQEEEFYQELGAIDQFRYFKAEAGFSPVPEETVKGRWYAMDTKNACNASAVAAWFGLKLRHQLGVPVGLVISAYGGTIVETWTSREALLANPTTKALMQEQDAAYREEKVWRELPVTDYSRYAIPDTGNEGLAKGLHLPETDDSEWADIRVPGSWISQKLAGNGAVWFRKTVDISPEWVGHDLSLEIPGIDKQDVTYFNGEEVGRTGEGLDISFWNKPRTYTIPAGLVKAGRNVIAIRVYSFICNGGFFGPSVRHLLHGPDGDIPLYGTWKAFVERDLGELEVPSPARCCRMSPLNVNSLSAVYNAMLNPLIPYAVQGVIWYQGESNAVSISKSQQYLSKLAAMIRDWRFRWGLPNLPFIQVQLACFEAVGHEQTWAYLRDAQFWLCQQESDVYLVTAIDVGEADDIHPQDKKSVGNRLADSALHHVYRRSDVVPCGPQFLECHNEGHVLRVSFKYARGLTLRTQQPGAFEVAGNDGRYFPAELVQVDGETLLVSSEKVSVPSAVRYAWLDCPVSTLFNAAGLPAAAFDSHGGC
ncbi:MAG: hypothetical protein IJJ33_05765 [Victivallales bacterium]|nr:hypothetical protein [Victivallales bacterium]